MELAITIAGLLVKYGPDVAEAFQRMVASGRNPTQEDWEEVFSKARKSYQDYIREAQLRDVPALGLVQKEDSK